jgi:hypothetical protein
LSFTILIMEKMRLDYLQNLNFKDRFWFDTTIN